MKLDLHTIGLIADLIADAERGEDRADEPGFLDTLDGETDALDLADRLIAETLADDALAAAAKAQADALAERAKRIAERGQSKRRAMMLLMGAISVRKLERPRGTISLRAGSVRVHITDDDAVPTQLKRTKTVVEPDKAAIKAQIEAGEAVPGAELVRGDDSVTLRVA